MSARAIPPSLAIGLAATLLGWSSVGAADPETLVVASFGSPWTEALQQALAPFEAEHNVKIRYTAGSSSDNVVRAIAARNHPDVDVVMGEEMTHGQGRQETIWEKLDPSIVTNLASVVPQAKVFGGEGVGIISQSIGLFYRTDTFQKNGWAAPTSWSDLLDKRFCHRAGFNDPNVSFGYYAFMMLGGGKPDDVPNGIKRAVAGKDCIDTLDPSGAKLVEKAQLGEYDIGVLAHYLVTNLAKKGVPLKFTAPREGAILQFTTAAVPKNAPHPELAQALVNELLSPRVQRQLSEQFDVGPVNPTVTVSAERIVTGVPDPKNLNGYIGVDAQAILPHRRQYIQDAIRALSQ
ncbi:MAG: extracellular solute-binding protein [Hyphomicrobiales bacterium]